MAFDDISNKQRQALPVCIFDLDCMVAGHVLLLPEGKLFRMGSVPVSASKDSLSRHTSGTEHGCLA